MIKKLLSNFVFMASASIIFILVIIGALFPNGFGRVSNLLYNIMTDNFSWFYLMTVFVITVFLLFLAISKFGSIRLGPDKEKPEFSFVSWIAMLFSAGFGAGLVFWGVAEPMSHFLDTPLSGVAPQSEEAGRLAMGYAFFHWGISQWSVFAIVGLVIAFLQFKKKQNGLISTALTEVTGEKPNVKKAIDSFAVIATVMGIATSLGLGVLQMNGGLNIVYGIDNSFGVQLTIFFIILVAYMISSTTGLKRGIKILSNVNLGIAVGLFIFVFFAGPTVFILEVFTLGLGDYISNFVQYSFRLQPYQEGTWVKDWTVFYWAWVIAWSPFVGAFVARVSKGRTIREYIMGVMIVPPLIALVWIATFGGTAIWYDLNQGTEIAQAVNIDLTSALFSTFANLPLSNIISTLAILLILTFLITSADSATFILSSMTSGGSLNPPQYMKFVWGFLMTAIAATLLYAGGLEALQTASLIAALPFTILMIMLMVSMIKLLSKEPLPLRKTDIKRFKRLEKAAHKKE